MPDLVFKVRNAEPVYESATPAIALRVEVSNKQTDQEIQTVVLRCQVQIETPRRRYNDREKARLLDVFGEPERWGQTLKSMLWANIATTVPAFTGSTMCALLVPCTFDFHVSATKYFHALDDGAIPITLMFSGTVFYRAADERLQAAPISWNTEARFSLPVKVWKDSVDLHYREMAWLCLRRDVFERLYEFKVRKGVATFEEAIECMLGARREVAAS